MYRKTNNPKENEGIKELGSQYMAKPLPQILDEMDANIAAAAEAARLAEEAARLAREAASTATKAAKEATTAAEKATNKIDERIKEFESRLEMLETRIEQIEEDYEAHQRLKPELEAKLRHFSDEPAKLIDASEVAKELGLTW